MDSSCQLASLGIAAPARRLAGSIVFATLLGLLLPQFLSETWEEVFEFVIIFGSSAIVVAITLLAVRRSGLRLVRADSWLTRTLFARTESS